MSLADDDVRGHYRELLDRFKEILELVDDADLPEFLVEFVRRVPSLEAVHDEVSTLLRCALVREGVVSSIAGDPRCVLTKEAVMTADDLLTEARIAGEARREILREEMLDATAVSRLLGSQSENLRQYANTLRRRGDLIGIPQRNQFLYPAFQIDVESRCVDRIVQEINRLLGADEDPWGVASWWLSPNDRLEGRAPRDALSDPHQRERLPAIAEAVIEPVG